VSQQLDIPEAWLDTEAGQALAAALSAMNDLNPIVGGLVGSIVSGRLVDRKLARLAQTIDFLRSYLGEYRVDIDETYAVSEDFAELLEEALLKAARDRSEAKRRAYARFLAQDLARPLATTYDIKLRLLRKLEDLQEGHLAVLAAIENEGRADDNPAWGPPATRLEVISARSGIQLEVTKVLCEDLSNEDLLTDWQHLNSRTRETGLVFTREELEHTRGFLSRLGRQLVSYLH
jgi:hypothetical protein